MSTKPCTPPAETTLREDIFRLVSAPGADDGAYVRAADLLEAAELQAMPALRLGILRSFTIEPILEVLKVKLFLEGRRLEPFLSEFNQIDQEIVVPSSPFYRFQPEVTLLAVRLEDLCPHAGRGQGPRPEEEMARIPAEAAGKIAGWMEAIGRNSRTHVFLLNFVVPAPGPRGIADTQDPRGFLATVRAANAELLRLRERFPQLHVVDVEHLAGQIGKERFCDPLQMYRMSNPFALSAYPALGDYLLSHWRALHGRQRKCLVMDLDNTLWGGILGEEGPEGIVLSDSYPGNCYQDLQRALLELSRRGILLAINSKNNPEDVLPVLRSHPGMVLREGDLSATRINWKDKAENLAEIAEELNLGLDALVFLDDNPAECERVRQACPEVLVVQLPPEKHLYRRTIESLSCFDQLEVTEEDRRRAELYRSQSRRQDLASRAATLEEFYASLEMKGVLSRNDPAHIARVAQLTQKTNQFNMTTRRYTAAEIARFMETGCVYSLRVEDRFGDNGIIAAAIALPEEQGRAWVIDTFLMSCRVVMRTIEETLLAQIAEDARACGALELRGSYLPSAKNGMVRDFYERQGLRVARRAETGETEYLLDVAAGKGPQSQPGAGPRPSPWMTLRAEGRLPR